MKTRDSIGWEKRTFFCRCSFFPVFFTRGAKSNRPATPSSPPPFYSPLPFSERHAGLRAQSPPVLAGSFGGVASWLDVRSDPLSRPPLGTWTFFGGVGRLTGVDRAAPSSNRENSPRDNRKKRAEKNQGRKEDG